MACKYYDITISSIDLAAAVNNTDPLNDGVVFAQYLDCNLTNTITVYDTAGVYPNAFCADDSQGVVLYYFNTDNQNIATNSSWTAVAICAAPTAPPVLLPRPWPPPRAVIVANTLLFPAVPALFVLASAPPAPPPPTVTV
jgi:hypothetical protein